jgi:hypothetical protein
MNVLRCFSVVAGICTSAVYFDHVAGSQRDLVIN